VTESAHAREEHQERLERSLLDFWFVLYDGRWTIALVTLAALSTSIVLSLILPPTYEARAGFYVRGMPDQLTIFGGEQGRARTVLAPAASEELNESYLGVLGSRVLAERVQREFPHTTVFRLQRRDLDFSLSSEFMIEVYARDRSPERAAGIANAYVRHFNDLMGGFSMASELNRESTIEASLKEAQDAADEARKRLQLHREKTGTIDVEEEARLAEKQRSELQLQLEYALIEIEETESQLAEVEARLREELGGGEPADGDSLLARLRVELADGELALYQELRRSLIDLYVKKAQIAGKIEAARAAIRNFSQRIEDLPGHRLEEQRLLEAIERQQAQVSRLELNVREARAQARRSLQVAVVVDAAVPPDRPAFPEPVLNGMLALAGGPVAGALLVFLLDFLERTRGRRLFTLVRELERLEGA
jgi:uncharacterized protein involved in exopolysaccharide biosynthesis